MHDGVIYWLVGQRHDEHLVVSLLSLRDHWSGPVTIVAGDDNAARLALACAKQLPPVDVVYFDYFDYKRHHPGKTFYLCKCLLWQYAIYDRTVFLDADTLVVAPFPELWPSYDTGEVRLTQFAGWVTTGSKMRGRLAKWKTVRPEDVAEQSDRAYPALNTGVFSFSRNSRAFMTEWLETTKKNVIFMADELAAQLIFPHFPHVIMDQRFNASPVYSECDDVRIWHGHGFKFHRKPRGLALWLPMYRRALEMDIAGIQQWSPTKKFRSYYTQDHQSKFAAAEDVDDDDED